MDRVILIDGNNILFRSYYATAYRGNILRNSKGYPTNALYGLINMLNKIIAEEKPTYVMVAFDKGKTFRHDKYESYKEGRIETPDDLKLQFPKAKELVEAMGLNYLEVDNYEADDIIGTFAHQAALDPNMDATIISSDKDLLQLITDDVEVKLLKQVGFERMRKTDFIKTYGFEPIRMIDLKALMGDSSDNIPGVKGVGEKTAIKLIQEYGSLDAVYENIDNIKGKLKERLVEGKESAYMSYDLATIYLEVPIDTDFEKIKYNGYDPLKYIALLEDLEFHSLIKKMDLDKDLLKNKEAQTLEYQVIEDMKDLKITGDFSIYPEIFGYSYQKDELLSFSIYDGENLYYIPKEVFLKDSKILSSKYNKYTYDLKRLLYLLKRNNLEIENANSDLMIAAYLLNYNVKDDIAYLMNSLGSDIEFYDKLFGTPAKLAMPNQVSLIEESLKKAKFIYEESLNLEKELEKDGQLKLYQDIEVPLANVLCKMEYLGIKVDEEVLDKIGEDITKKLKTITEEIYSISNKEFNIASPKQLAEVLFKDLEIPYPKKIKGDNYSTAADILSKIRSFHPIISLVEEFRMLSKIYGTYVVGLKNEIVDGRIHTIFNQTLARTGRLSSSNPNLQNIPIRTEEGRKIRKAFVPEANSIILASDYSQIELRVFAHMSKAPNLVDAFNSNKDIHTKTAMDIFKVTEDKVSSNMRREAKAVNFGIIYGISAFGLSEDLGIDINSAKKFIDTYLATFPGLKDYMDQLIANAKNDGYVRTIMNRKRIIPELKDKNYMIRSNGERMALNTPIQGSSAEIIKKAMIEIDKALTAKNMRSKLLLQVHDELVFNVVKEEEQELASLVKSIMENTYELIVPLKVEINSGDSWYETK